MQHLEPDMEDLLRRASDSYPLKQGEDKWNDIAARMALKNTPDPVAPKQWWQRKGLYSLLLFLFISASGLLMVHFAKQSKTSIALKEKQTTAIGLLPVNDTKSKSQTTTKIELPNNTIALPKQQIAATHFPADVKSHSPKIKPIYFIKAASQKAEEVNNETAAGNAIDTRRSATQQAHFTKNNFYKNISSTADSTAAISVNKSLVLKNEVAFNQNDTEKQADSLMAKSKLAKVNSKATKGFYYGALAGVGLNGVQNQPFNKAGFDAGIVVGYRFGKRVSLEAGLVFAKKFYWTDGKLFSTNEMGATMPAETTITEVQGSSRIIELPLHLRYDFFSRANDRFYVVAGLSSYSIMEENNDYATMHNGIKGTMHGSYQKDRRYFAATADVGLGYEMGVGRNHLRFQPYLQLPVKGVGVGFLHVKTAGLKIIFTRPAH